jgi:hypothetical protein
MVPQKKRGGGGQIEQHHYSIPTASKANNQDAHKKVPKKANDRESVSTSSTYLSNEMVHLQQENEELQRDQLKLAKQAAEKKITKKATKTATKP